MRAAWRIPGDGGILANAAQFTLDIAHAILGLSFRSLATLISAQGS